MRKIVSGRIEPIPKLHKNPKKLLSKASTLTGKELACQPGLLRKKSCIETVTDIIVHRHKTKNLAGVQIAEEDEGESEEEEKEIKDDFYRREMKTLKAWQKVEYEILPEQYWRNDG